MQKSLPTTTGRIQIILQKNQSRIYILESLQLHCHFIYLFSIYLSLTNFISPYNQTSLPQTARLISNIRCDQQHCGMLLSLTPDIWDRTSVCVTTCSRSRLDRKGCKKTPPCRFEWKWKIWRQKSCDTRILGDRRLF